MPRSTVPRMAAGERLRRLGISAWSIIGLLILAYASFQALLRISIVFPPLVLALLILYLLNPLVSALERRRVPRVLGAVGAYVVVVGVLTIVVIALIPFIGGQVRSFGEEWPHYRTRILGFVDNTTDSLEDRFNTDINTSQFSCLLGADETSDDDAPTDARCDEVTHDVRDAIMSQASRATEIGSSVLEVILVFIIGPLIALYLLIDLPSLRRDVMNLVPDTHKEEVSELGSKIGTAVGGFFRGQLLVALTVGVLSALGFRIIDLPAWFLIGSIAGFFNLIPLVGPFIGGTIGFLVGLISQGVGLGLKAALVELVVQQLDNHVISPNIMKRTVNLHPVTVMLSLLAGGAIAGFWGVLLGVPAVAVGKIVMGHVWATRVLGQPVSTTPEGPLSEEPTPVPGELRVPAPSGSDQPGGGGKEAGTSET